jgi:hypothetical protein
MIPAGTLALGYLAIVFAVLPITKGTFFGVMMRAMSRNIALATPGKGFSACNVTQAMTVISPAGK